MLLAQSLFSGRHDRRTCLRKSGCLCQAVACRVPFDEATSLCPLPSAPREIPLLTSAQRFFCPCCQHQTLPEKPPGSFEVCPVCAWEDDSLQFASPDSSDGANAVSLNDARKNFRAFGASDRALVDKVRPALPEEPLKPTSKRKPSPAADEETEEEFADE